MSMKSFIYIVCKFLVNSISGIVQAQFENSMPWTQIRNHLHRGDYWSLESGGNSEIRE